MPDSFQIMQGTQVFAAMVTSADSVSTLKQNVKFGSLALVLSFEMVLKGSHRGHRGLGEGVAVVVVVIRVEVVGAFATRNTQALELFIRADSTSHDSLRIAIPLSNRIKYSSP